MYRQETGATEPRLDISPESSLVGEPWHLRVSGLQPGQAVTILAEQHDESGVVWKSHAGFTADRDGSVDPGVQAPNSGDYEGVDPSGIFWSMRPVSKKKPDSAFASDINPQKITVSIEVDGRKVSSRQTERIYMLPGVERKPVREKRVIGTLFTPAREAKRPAIVVLSGSGGGVNEPIAATFASLGYVALALGFFGMDGLPDELVNIPVETVRHGIDWLEARPEVEPESIGMFAVSKGTELALLVASKDERVKAVVVNVPSGVVFEGLHKGTGKDSQSSWAFHGEPVPFVPFSFSLSIMAGFAWAKMARKPLSTRKMYEFAMNDSSAVEKAEIQVEKTRAPIMMLSSGQDGVWPSGRLSEMAMKRLRAHDHPYEDEHLHYEEAGHLIRFPYTPMTVERFFMSKGLFGSLGGTPRENARAALDSWPRVKSFLEKHLGQSAK